MKRAVHPIIGSFLIGIFLALGLSFAACAPQKQITVRYVAGEGGTIEGAAEQVLEEGENGTSVTARPDEGYIFVKWSDGGKQPTRRESRVRESMTLTAEFEAGYTLHYLTDGNGKIFGEADQTVGPEGDASVVMAIPDEGYAFVKWSDGEPSPTRADKNITADLTVTAEFEPKTCHAFYKVEGNGTLQGDRAQTVLYGEDASTVTAIPDEGYKFVKWSDGKTEPARTDRNITENLEVTAEFAIKKYSLHYLTEGGGWIKSKPIQTVEHGKDGETVTAQPDKGHEFMGWSDGLETPERTDRGITEDFEVTAIFDVFKFKVRYLAEGGGKIIGETYQRIGSGESGTKVTAVADAGYVFTGWSDLSWEAERDAGLVKRDRDFIAYFEPVQKQFRYDYGDLFRSPLLSTVLIDRNDLANANLIVPEMDGYTFLGWYTSEAYTTKVADETGRLMLGYQTFCLEETTLYARWKRADEAEDPPVCNILLTMTDELHALLYAQKLGRDAEVDYKMTGIERKIFALVPQIASEYLNAWFEGKVLFEVDAYFTTVPVGTVTDRVSNSGYVGGSGDSTISGSATLGYELYAYNIPEVRELLGKYHSVLNTYGFNDYEAVLAPITFAGASEGKKYGVIWIEPNLWNEVQRLPSFYQALLERDESYTEMLIDTYLHEFIHTIEAYYEPEIYPFHKALYETDISDPSAPDTFEIMRLYLLKRFEVNGEMVGIPEEFWQHKAEFWQHEKDVFVLYYWTEDIDDPYGRVQIVGHVEGEKDIYSEKFFIYISVPYGSDVCAEAIPNEGFRFVRWEDGVTTAVRHDRNITSNLHMRAIFEKIIV